jgi:hypothetical protein
MRALCAACACKHCPDGLWPMYVRPGCAHQSLRVSLQYRNEFAGPNGRIGLALNSGWCEPYTDSTADREAAERTMAWYVPASRSFYRMHLLSSCRCLRWFSDPVYKGDYPAAMRDTCGDRLPFFTEEQRARVSVCHVFGAPS